MTFDLKRGKLQAKVRAKGGELVSLTDGEGQEHIWEGNPAFWAGQNPILFPIVGTLKMCLDGNALCDGCLCDWAIWR